jgi:hypothetical protein
MVLPRVVAGLAVGIEFPTRCRALGINAATHRLPDLASQRDAAHLSVFGAAHRDQIRADRNGDVLGHGALGVVVRLAEIERNAVGGAAGAAVQARLGHEEMTDEGGMGARTTTARKWQNAER